MNPFSPNYKSSFADDTAKALKASGASSRNATKRRENGMKSDDPAVRMQASGFIPGMGTPREPDHSDRIKRGNSRVGS